MRLGAKILFGLILGLIAGLCLGPVSEVFKPIGSVFLSLISMIIVPLVLSSIVICITSIQDPRKLSRVGLKSFGLYLGTTIAAIIIGIFFAKIFEPGMNLKIPLPTPDSVTPVHLGDIVMALVPKNPVMALAEGNILQIIIFALCLGIAINCAGEQGRLLVEVFESILAVMYKLTSILMEFSPIGVFAIMAWVSGTFGISVLFPLAKFLVIYYLACFFHVTLIFFPILKFLARMNPWPFFRGMSHAIMMAFSTCSSSVTLPISMHCVQKNLGVSRDIASYIMPLGSTINMNGAALFQGMSAVFLAQVCQIELGWQNLIAIIVTATFSAIGATGIPGSGFLMLTYVFGSVGLPIEGLALFASIDHFREMVSTVLNVMGDAVCAVYIAKEEGELDERTYYHENILELEADEA